MAGVSEEETGSSPGSDFMCCSKHTQTKITLNDKKETKIKLLK